MLVGSGLGDLAIEGMGYHERGMTSNTEKYAYEDNPQYDGGHVIQRREDDLHVRNVATGGYKVPRSVIEK